MQQLDSDEVELAEIRQNFLITQKNYRNCQAEYARTISYEKNLKTDIEANFF